MPAKLTFDQLRNTAQSMGGKCLSPPEAYRDSTSRLHWQCERGHEWVSTVGNVRHGCWCKRCRFKMPDFHVLQQKAKERGGMCLSLPEDYLNAFSALSWQCAEGHTWSSAWSNVRVGKWCSQCAGISKPKFSQFTDTARSQNGACLSAPGDYVNRNTLLRWRCSKGHEWLAKWTHIQRGHWCVVCAGNLPPTFEQIRSKATERGGICLSGPTDYENNTSKLQWQCGNGHAPWEARWTYIKSGSWCPACLKKTEGLVRRFLETTLAIPLPSTSPPWLRTSGKARGFILDGYNAAHAVAFEYHGAQHFRHVDRFHRNGYTLERQQARDEAVRKLCAENGVRLIEIPCLDSSNSIENVISLCLPAVEAIIGEVPTERIEFFRAEPLHTGMLERMKAFANAKQGACAARYYLGATTNYPFRCEKGHVWSATWHSVQKGTWCPYCAKRVRPTIAELQALATARGGSSLTKEGEYKNNKIPLGWRCAEAHEWRANWNNISGGAWCPHCASRPRTAKRPPSNAAASP